MMGFLFLRNHYRFCNPMFLLSLLFDFQSQNRLLLYINLLASGKLNDHLIETDETANDRIEYISRQIEGFKSHPFKVTVNEDFKKLTDSIMENGVLIPAVARPKGDGYELIAGHRRKAVCEKLGIETMPVIVKNMTDEQSVIFMVDSNVQRENILPSEKAFAFKMKMDALKRQGQRNDLTSTPVAWKSQGKETAEIVGEATGDSKDQVRRYVRLT
ncbi:MAG: ParB/RepB/Spo0J family partition protein, partial [Oscillospiraceae bacterium]|nr:ParB/RepB/Spo0J family partition protein [Oscillospiraceae bacterium]